MQWDVPEKGFKLKPGNSKVCYFQLEKPDSEPHEACWRSSISLLTFWSIVKASQPCDVYMFFFCQNHSLPSLPLSSLLALAL